jgi:RNA polymerase sigma factor (sigma-70 family)
MTSGVLPPPRQGARPEEGGIPDGELLERFRRGRDEAAFEQLMGRHGPMVLGVCRHVLRNGHDAEDCFQTTFLALARKAGMIGRSDSVGGWLCTVAYRTALRARARAARFGQPAAPLDEVAAAVGPDPADGLAWRDLGPLLEAEVRRLSAKYRAAFVLCLLEGKTCDEAAAALGCARGTIASRLARGRECLRKRLAARGWPVD